MTETLQVQELEVGSEESPSVESESVPTTMEMLRKQKRMSQYRLAHRIGKHQPEISSYEAGHVKPSLLTLKLIADELGWRGVPTDLLKPFTETVLIQPRPTQEVAS